jgi:hypothetical protein
MAGTTPAAEFLHMIEWFNDGRVGRFLGIRATGEVTAADYSEFVGRAQEYILEWDELNVLLDLSAIKPSDWKKLGAPAVRLPKTTRLAIVGNAALGKSLPGVEVRRFDGKSVSKCLDEARLWLSSVSGHDKRRTA